MDLKTIGRSTMDEVTDVFFHYLTHFEFDKAKDFVDKEKDACKTGQDVAIVWPLILNAFGLLALAEKSYSSFLYLSLKWFGRRDVKNPYEAVSAECKKIESQGLKPRAELSHLTHLCGQIAEYVTAKSFMVEFFEVMHDMGSSKFGSRNDLLIKIEPIIETSDRKFHHPRLSQLKTSFMVECRILKHLLKADQAMALYRFMDALLELQEAHTAVNQLVTSTTAPSAKESWKLSFSGVRTATTPIVHTWLRHYKNAVYSKFSLYFYDVLSKQAPGGDMKPYLARCPTDFYSRIVNFCKKTEAYMAALILHTDAKDIRFKGKGYQPLNRPNEDLQGLALNRVMFGFPQDAFDAEGQIPNIHLASLLMIMARKEKHNELEKPVDEYDQKNNSTYFVILIDTHVSLIVIYKTKKSEREKKTVLTFLIDLSSELRYTKLFAELRPS